MVSKIALLFSSLFVLLIGLSIQQTCPDPGYEDYTLKALPFECQPACYITNVTGVTPCPKPSGPGCVCKSGNIRTNDGRCIFKSRCPPPGSPCPTSFQEYKDSIVDPACQRTCTNPQGISPCPLPNVAGCQCTIENFRDLSSNRCMPLPSCPRIVTVIVTQVPTDSISTLSPASQPITTITTKTASSTTSATSASSTSAPTSTTPFTTPSTIASSTSAPSTTTSSITASSTTTPSTTTSSKTASSSTTSSTTASSTSAPSTTALSSTTPCTTTSSTTASSTTTPAITASSKSASSTLAPSATVSCTTTSSTTASCTTTPSTTASSTSAPASSSGPLEKRNIAATVPLLWLRLHPSAIISTSRIPPSTTASSTTAPTLESNPSILRIHRQVMKMINNGKNWMKRQNYWYNDRIRN